MPTQVALCSIFRNSTKYIDKYFEQISRLKIMLEEEDKNLRLYLGYGDSTDGTGELLHEACIHRFSAVLIDVSHGGPEFGPEVNATRFKQLAYCGNKVLEHLPLDTAQVIWVESDLVWYPNVLTRLLRLLDEYSAACPMIFDAGGLSKFYDTWAFRIHGIPFTKDFPHHRHLMSNYGGIHHLDSGGSCMAIRGEVAHHVRFTNDEVFVGLSKQIWDQGGTLVLDSGCYVTHPWHDPKISVEPVRLLEVCTQ